MIKRKTFSKEFKLEAVRLLEQSGKSPNEIAIDLGECFGRPHLSRSRRPTVLSSLYK